jgi:serine/threonine-protein kinase
VPRSAIERSDGDPLLGLLVDARFAVLGLIGAGALAAVYRARDLAAGQNVALKVVRSDRLIDSSVRDRFEREAAILCALESPYSAAAIAWGAIEDDALGGTTAQGALYLAMELLDGESLGTRLQRVGRLEPRDAVRFACHCLHSLGEAHRRGIVHRDIKPDNLLLVARASDGVEVCRVIDFGLAAAVGRVPNSDPPPSVRASTLAPSRRGLQGTPRYMAPEQIAGLPLDARADLYSLGAVLYHMLTGRPPFAERDAKAVMNQHLREPPPPFREVVPDAAIPAELEALVMRALAKEPAQRTRSAEVFLQALGAIEPSLCRAVGGPVAGSMPPIPMPSLRGRGRLGIGLGAAAGLAALGGAAAFVLFGADGATGAGASPVPTPGVASAAPSSTVRQVALGASTATNAAPDGGVDAGLGGVPGVRAPAPSARRP